MTESKRLPILCLDFDGVCHSYTSGWKGADTIPDEYVPGLFEFLEAVKDDFDVQVLSSRSHQPGGREAMMVWFIEQRKLWRSRGGMPPEDTPLTIGFPTEKPPAVVTLDDRGLLFTGVWPTVDELKSFKPWYLNRKDEADMDEQTITVSFTKGIRPDGELARFVITQPGYGELRLTLPQAKSLMETLAMRLPVGISSASQGS